MPGNAVKPNITVALLSSYFAVVKDLKTYLSEILEPLLPDADGLIQSQAAGIAPSQNDTPAYLSLLNTSYVAFNTASLSTARPFKLFLAKTDMREVIDKAQERIFSQGNYTQNIISAGYKRAYTEEDRPRQDMTRIGITNIFVNTIVTALQSSEWDMLLQRLVDSNTFNELDD
ncbi:hypothetical protein H0H81_010059 [Sphagnurus paluster]|uniref:Uncharacterized protein n=1 Tax=Sphagnurus paluster TaxID=117069 RepID=A0A9P7FRU6_9AGAR|nr:hypothetical protein H0H81_010059 [Sphagnurus paluster]